MCRLRPAAPGPAAAPAELGDYYPANYWFAPDQTAAGRWRKCTAAGAARSCAFVTRAVAGSGLAGPVLDVGCGGGLFLRHAGRARRGLGLDSPPTPRRSRGRERGARDGGSLECGSAAPGSCAAVTMFHVLEHLYDPRLPARGRELLRRMAAWSCRCRTPPAGSSGCWAAPGTAWTCRATCSISARATWRRCSSVRLRGAAAQVFFAARQSRRAGQQPGAGARPDGAARPPRCRKPAASSRRTCLLRPGGGVAAVHAGGSGVPGGLHHHDRGARAGMSYNALAGACPASCAATCCTSRRRSRIA